MEWGTETQFEQSWKLFDESDKVLRRLMSEESHSHGMPPILEPGGVLRFTSIEHLAKVYERELHTGRVTAIDTAGNALFVEDDHMLVVAQSSLRIPIRAQSVYRQGDVVGLQLSIEESALRRLRESIDSVETSPEVSDSLGEDTASVDEAVQHSDELPSGAAVERAAESPAGIRAFRSAEPDESGGKKSDVRGETSTEAMYTDPDYFGLLVETGQAGLGQDPSHPTSDRDAHSEAATEAVPLEHQTSPSLKPKDDESSASVRAAVPTEQGSIRPIHRPEDYLDTTSVYSVFSLLVDCQRRAVEGRLTFFDPGRIHELDFNERGHIIDFSIDLSGHFIAAGLVG